VDGAGNPEALPRQVQRQDHYSYEIVQADGLNQLQDGAAPDSGDPFPGSTDNHTFSRFSHPAAVWWDGTDIGIEILNIISPATGDRYSPLQVVFLLRDRTVPELSFFHPPGGFSANGLYTVTYDTWDNYGGTLINLYRTDVNSTTYAPSTLLQANISKLAGDQRDLYPYNISALAAGRYRFFALLQPWADPEYDDGIVYSSPADKGRMTITGTNYLPYASRKTQYVLTFNIGTGKFDIISNPGAVPQGSFTPPGPFQTTDTAFTFSVTTGTTPWATGDTITFTPRYESGASTPLAAASNTGNATIQITSQPLIDPANIPNSSTLQTWTLSYDGTDWTLTGSVTGVSSSVIPTGTLTVAAGYSTGVGNTGNFTVRLTVGVAQSGDYFVFKTTGLTPIVTSTIPPTPMTAAIDVLVDPQTGAGYVENPAVSGEADPRPADGGPSDSGAGNSTADGVADAWELQWFGNLTTARPIAGTGPGYVDGFSDYDRDGLNDLYEYLAGTNPRSGRAHV
jgi:hypothetical protein